jgi:hypothetical protein
MSSATARNITVFLNFYYDFTPPGRRDIWRDVLHEYIDEIEDMSYHADGAEVTQLMLADGTAITCRGDAGPWEWRPARGLTVAQVTEMAASVRSSAAAAEDEDDFREIGQAGDRLRRMVLLAIADGAHSALDLARAALAARQPVPAPAAR